MMKNINFKIKRLLLALGAFVALCLPVSSLAGNATYTYDAYDRVVRVDYDKGPVVEYTYDLSGNLASRTVVDRVLHVGTGGTGQGSITDVTPAADSCGEGCYFYSSSQSVTVTAAPAGGYVLGSWSESACGAALSCTVTVDSLKHVTANFYSSSYTITSGAGENGSIDPFGITDVTYGTNLSLSIIPDEGYRTSDISVDSTSVGILDEYTFSNISASHNILANFVVDPVSISPSIYDFGAVSCGATSSEAVITLENGGTLTRTVESVSITGGASAEYSVINDGCTNTQLSPNSTCTVGVIFAPTLKWSVRRAALSFDFSEEGTSLLNSELSGYGGDNCQGDISILIPIFTILNEESGAVTTVAQENGTIIQVDDKTFNIVADDAYIIKDVLVDGQSIGPATTYTFEDLYNSHSIEALFDIDPTILIPILEVIIDDSYNQ